MKLDGETLGLVVTCIALVTLLFVFSLYGQKRPKTGDGMIYAKYGCIPNDPSSRDWSQYMGLSPCR
ncbi:hypothetical protein PH552_00680 [Rhizobium sp. CNPSo 3968]|uniref:hypothetical protein n=1 Tax=Rhizobium sp. CNPSo 3968 TaxID=3021408 RepID=UPI002551409E|nr:hypothetical protein [Rhizobium sp. CNPSo 3968]MDK4717863.1 hypothetical protein [Rhizobium sp. CNPSo 3968]